MSSDNSISGAGFSPLPTPSHKPNQSASPLTDTATTKPVEAPEVRPDQRVEQSAETQEVSREATERMVERINAFAQEISLNLDFSVDDPTGQTVITVTERESGKLIRKIPSEEFLKLSQQIQDMNNLLFKEKV
ncbi:flagellar protein FlaG [Motiliproteus sp. SC1-56]|uniref:flagellar protein FlaG n=1 Tax=Motiliproteus sp. SC1-56 TaxID=2799565 RepID=UPI001A8CF393|nr:flagellar protein FlaG [Motiliproteus sp. SC1-56]